MSGDTRDVALDQETSATTVAGVAQVSKKPYLAVDKLCKSFGTSSILQDVSFDIEPGEFVCFLGPSGCGKTTLLLCLAGLEAPTRGEIYKNGHAITLLPPSQRDVGIVFQSYALFPNLNVYDNIAFGLVNMKWTQAKIRETVNGLLSLLSLEDHEAKYPNQLSGGQQQRVALARALAVSPSLLLLDEPLSALDAQVRARLRSEIRDLQQRLKITTVMVTHDQEEAQTLADRIVLMNAGRIEQIGTPWQIYNEPATAFVADFIGVSNLLTGVVSSPNRVTSAGVSFACDTGLCAEGTTVQLLVRPEDIAVRTGAIPQDSGTVTDFHGEAAKGGALTTAATTLEALVSKIEYLGPIVRVHMLCEPELSLKVDIAKRDFNTVLYRISQKLSLTVHACDIRLFKK